MLDDLQIVPVHPSNVFPILSGDVVELIEDANRKVPGEAFDIGVLRGDLQAGRRQLWLSVRDGLVIGLGITGQHTDDRGVKSLQILLVAGRDWPSWAWMLDPIERWARSHGCRVARFCGRKGWVRRMPESWRRTGETRGKGLIFEKALLDG